MAPQKLDSNRSNINVVIIYASCNLSPRFPLVGGVCPTIERLRKYWVSLLMTVCLRAAKALAASLNNTKFLKVHFLFPFSPSSLRYCTRGNSCPSEFELVTLIYETIDHNPRAFTTSCWLSNKFQHVVRDPNLFLRILNLIGRKPRIAFRFFRWVESQPRFKRSEFAFCKILEILVENNMMHSAYFVMERVVSLNLRGILDAMLDGYVSPAASIKLLDLLLWIYTKKSMLEQSYQLLIKCF